MDETVYSKPLPGRGRCSLLKRLSSNCLWGLVPGLYLYKIYLTGWPASIGDAGLIDGRRLGAHKRSEHPGGWWVNIFHSMGGLKSVFRGILNAKQGAEHTCVEGRTIY